MKKLLTYILILMPLLSLGQSDCFGKPDKELPFAVGEKLKFSVDYSSAIFSTAVADVHINVLEERFGTVPCFKIDAIGRTRPFFNLFFELEDRYTTIIDTAKLRPYKATSNLKEGGFLFRTDFTYNWSKGIVNTFAHNLKRDWKYYKTLPLKGCSYDALALFYNMRRIDAAALKQGQVFNLDLVLEDTIRNVQVRFWGREIKRLENLGRFRTLKFSCKFAVSNDETFKDGAEFFVWISDDKNKIPIYLESPIRVGKVVVYLSSWEGLQNPFSSIVPK